MSAEIPLVIVNPAAGGGAAGRDWARAASTIRIHFGPFACAFTRCPEDALRIAEEEARAGRRLLVAYGGDGTISEIAGGILRSGAPAELGLLPHGTGGDFLRTLGIPSRLADAARALRDSRTWPIDVGKVSYTTPKGSTDSRYFVNVSSFGMSGEVARRANLSSKRLGGRLTFAASTLRAAVSFRHPEVWLELENEPPRRLRITEVSVSNGRYFGGGMKIAPEAQLADGWLDVTVIGKISFLEILARGPRLYTGTHLHLPKVHHSRARSLTARPVHQGKAVYLEVDGETPGKLPARFEVCPGALRVRVPL